MCGVHSASGENGDLSYNGPMFSSTIVQIMGTPKRYT